MYLELACMYIFTGLTMHRPDLMAKVIAIHNEIMEKAKDANFGSIIKQEGGGPVAQLNPHDL